jgi:signal transduction histidine kinase
MRGTLNSILSSSDSRSIYLANVLSLIFASLVLGLVVILLLLFGWSGTIPFILGVAGVFLLVILLNYLGFHLLGRLISCLVPIWATLVISILGKLESDKQSYIIYFDSRYILLATAILPAIVFELEEKVALILCLASTFFCLMMFDPIHNWIGVGYYQRGFQAQSYYYINYITLISYIALVSGVIILKWQNAKAKDLVAQALQENLSINQELQDKSNEIEAQNEELLQQQEEITTNAEKLEEANTTIVAQSTKLEQYNQHLEQLVEEKSGDLLKTNTELVKTINELRQFSFSISHNLRAPVARLLGLTNLISLDGNNWQMSVRYIQQSATELDEIIKDLTAIVEIRNELYTVKEKISIQEELDKSLAIIGLTVEERNIILSDIKEPYVFGIRPMVQSILYNLISNSLKFASPNRPLEVKVKSFLMDDGQIAIEVSDNGLGFDTKLHHEKLFGLYKRFHTHVAGKGIGLHLVKSQIEIMGGQVQVQSSIDRGATFRLIFPVPEDLDKQIFFENESAELYYDALINNTVIIWKKNVTSDQYRQAFESVLQTIKKYNTPGWIADLRNQGAIAPEDQQWFMTNVLKAAADNGLNRIAAIGFDDPIRKDYYERMIAKTAEYGVTLKVFHSMDSAVKWMTGPR